MQRYFLYLAYNGTRYHGWQVQPNGVTVQERIDEAFDFIITERDSDCRGGKNRDAWSTCPFVVCTILIRKMCFRIFKG